MGSQAVELTKSKADNATCEIDDTSEEVNDEAGTLSGELEGELGCVLNQGAGGGEEGPDELDEGGDEVTEGVDDGRHDVGWWCKRVTLIQGVCRALRMVCCEGESVLFAWGVMFDRG